MSAENGGMRRGGRRHQGALVAAVVAAALLTSCTTVAGAVPDCDPGPRLAVVAQSVPGASYVPCIRQRNEEWGTRSFRAGRGGSRFTLVPNRPGGRPVKVEFRSTCDVSGAVPTTPRAEGVRTSIHVATISPRYTGTLADVFAGGCVTYRFDFARGPHIALMEQLDTIVGLVPRRELRLEIHDQLGVDLDR
ncbi:MAG: hypothetical protein M3203_17180 [Actinomycetota bacterium]|nr:hypothetical protein [Actinomycetota bacterium]